MTAAEPPTPVEPPAPAEPPTPSSHELTPGVRRVAAVVLAGGASRRFGSDKLATALDGVPLLEWAIAELPTDWPVILVGPTRQLSATLLAGRTVITVREEPAGSGPAAAVVAGVGAALSAGTAPRAEVVVTLPGDAPAGGAAARVLVGNLLDTTDPEPASAVVGVDVDGVEQPLQFAAKASVLADLAARTDAAGLPARSLLTGLGRYRRVALPAELTADVDTTDDLTTWRR
ncbi:molybdenum cofactor guanylyltransferase [Microlunatus soli]|uniref:Molybdopterin-guanine dinucleotide biosynthesis protein A n=1 Tax=Microlunatus soli TaxID=630515 RepID=A0A1H1VZS3_9ACTN|nr:NTP transferase domain-containing protein [Microlunatus soli]SDS89940.1 Molybdopterin-guanine dinucleotide biosynthesis protein A [Microlunatus soli]